MKQSAILILIIVSAMSCSFGESEHELRTYTVFPGELAQRGWEALDLESLENQQDWFEKKLPKFENSPTGWWYDVRPILEEMDIEFGENDFAIWNEPMRALVVWVPEKVADKLDETFGPWTDAEHHQILVEALCVRCAPAVDPAVYLERVPTVSEVLKGKMGRPELLNRVSLRGRSGQRGRVLRENTGNIEKLLFEFDPALGFDGYTIDLNFNYEVEFSSGEAFSQTTASVLSPNRPLLLELGGAGTEKSPMYYLVLRASVPPLKTPRTESAVDPFSPKADPNDPFSDLGQ